MKEKIYNVFEKQTNMERRNAQIVYLNDIGWEEEEIAGLVGLTVATIRRYIIKFADLLEKAKQWFGKVITTISTRAREKFKNPYIIYECEHHKGDCAYIIEYFDDNKNFLFLKVGMTNNIGRRISEHMREYRKDEKYQNITYAKVKNLYYAEDEEDALTLENLLRKHYKKIENNGFIRRDRFSNVRYNIENLKNDIDLQNKIQLFVA